MELHWMNAMNELCECMWGLLGSDVNEPYEWIGISFMTGYEQILWMDVSKSYEWIWMNVNESYEWMWMCLGINMFGCWE